METTTLAIEKSIHKRASKRAKREHISLSAVARKLLDAYASGKINIIAVQVDPPVQIYEHELDELPTEIKKAALRAYKKKKSDLLNI